MTIKGSRERAALVALTSVFLFVTACSTALTGPPRADTPDVTRTNEDIPEGPGLFSGEAGGLVFGRDTKKQAKPAPQDAQQTQAQARQLEEQSKQFDRQIEELERQRRELEALKEELKQILKTAPRPQ